MQVDNTVVRTWGEAREEDGLKNHVDLVLLLDLVDLEAGTAVAGAHAFSMCTCAPPKSRSEVQERGGLILGQLCKDLLCFKTA